MNATNETIPVLYDQETAAKLLAVTPRWLRDRVAARTIPHHRLGQNIRFSSDDIEAIVAMYEAPVVVAGG